MSSQPQAASSAILVRDGRLLLIRRRNPPAADLYAFPGGRAEPGETPAETALREFHEETGIRAENPRLFATYDLRGEHDAPARRTHFFLSVFLVEAASDAEAVAADDASDAGWFTPEEIRGLPAPESVVECAERLRIFLDELS
ncbi:NUDIX domain-containing protein [Rhizobiaceae bacterium BDR2-2]|uniref:NUDIX domain-containing protein n=1 Tax=Ectorhizobium quercum TaxID=2965071 RepID=A0AAE3SWE8_9HYPH|nr:NUDIX domain-containing protein [Ectorhizobium quercum]MCX8999067.1 NUDIX domain-containing protein [Ectorhizobium quercum]